MAVDGAIFETMRTCAGAGEKVSEGWNWAGHNGSFRGMDAKERKTQNAC